MEHNCPLTNITITRTCPVRSCMWNCGPRLLSGCVKDTSIESNLDLMASIRGVADLDTTIDEATHNIERLVILDEYINYLESLCISMDIKDERIVVLARNLSRHNERISVTKLVLASSKKLWKRFKRKSGAKGSVLHEVIGISIKELNILRAAYVSEQSKLTEY